MAERSPGCVVIGIGNPGRGDDDAGRAVARQLCEKLAPEVRVVEHDGEPSTLLVHLAAAPAAFLIDACQSSASPGTIHCFDVSRSPLPAAGFNLSTHGLGLLEAIELARTLGELPALCIVYAIEAASFEPGAPLSLDVATAIGEVSDRIANKISAIAAEQSLQ